jgi:ankyrin repeat protein
MPTDLTNNELCEKISRACRIGKVGDIKSALKEDPKEFSKAVNSLNKKGEPPLFDAVRYGNFSCFKFLLDNGADPTIESNSSYKTILSLAGASSHLNSLEGRGAREKIIELILSLPCAGKLIKNGEGFPLHKSIESGGTRGLDTALLLIKAGADINQLDNDQHTALDVLCKHPTEAENVKREETLALELITRGADIEHKDKSLNTPLHWACFSGNKALVEILIKHGANLNAQECEGNTPLHITCMGIEDKRGRILHNAEKIIGALLIEAGAEIKIKNKRGETPLSVAKEKKSDCLDLLKKATAKKIGKTINQSLVDIDI